MNPPLEATAVGIGLKVQHVREVLDASAPLLDFFEVHAENYMVDGGPFPAHLARIRERYAVSLHGVGLSIGGEAPLDRDHVERLAALVERYEPALVSEHLAWSSHGGVAYNDLLPIVYDRRTLARVCAHVDALQQRLRRRVLIENPSTYVEFEASTLEETQFIGELVRRTGCGLLLDVNNAYVSAVNHGRDAHAYLAALPLAAVGEIHLAGFAEDRDAAGDRLLIDAHGSPVDAAVWALYEYTLRIAGARPTLIERDADIPALEVLCAEARRAARALDEAALLPRQAAAA